MSEFASIYAALLTPRDAAGEIDVDSFRLQLKGLSGKGLAGFAVNGATGEFTASSEDDLRSILATTRETAPESEVLCCIGAADVHGAIRRGELAAEYGSKAVLLPMPCFFPYRQDDLKAFALAVASAVEVPVLLYNLPQFTSGLEVGTVLELFAGHDNIVGIKDSSGSLDIVRAMTAAGRSEARLIGNDNVLAAALREGVCDGLVSGVACALPELMAELFSQGKAGAPFEALELLLLEFIEQINPLPTPWGLKAVSAVRGWTRPSYPLPLSPERDAEIRQLQQWFEPWFEEAFKSSRGAA